MTDHANARRIATLLTGLLLTVTGSLAGCSDESTGEASPECRFGWTAGPDGTCIPPRPPTPTIPGTSDEPPRSSEGDTSDPPSPSTSSSGSDPDLSCEPGASYCANPVTAAVCNETGDGHVEETPCPDGEVCRQRDAVAICLPGNADRCEPGDLVHCAGPASFVACGQDGFPEDVPSNCPPETPFCRSGMGCTDAICNPGIRSCDGNQVVECSQDGQSQTPITNCPAGCAAGQCIDPCDDDGKGSYVGCDFFAVYLDNSVPANNVRRPWAVTVSNTSSTSSVDISILDANGDALQESTLGPSTLETFQLPPREASRSEIHNDSFRISATGPITVHQFNPLDNIGAFSNDASLLFPSNALGQRYLVLSWPRITNRTGFVTVIAAEDDGPTEVRIRPTAPVESGSGVPAMAVGTWNTLTLNPGQVLNLVTLATQGDFTGTEIEADRRISVFAGAQSTQVPIGTSYADHLEQQLFPTEIWGDSYVAAKFRPRGNEPDVYRVMALHDGTRIETTPNIPNVHGQMLASGAYLQFQERRHFEIRGVNAVDETPAPILLGQFMTGSNMSGIPSTCPAGCGGLFSPCSTGIGDPTYVLNVPTRQFLSDYVFYVPADYRENNLSIVARPSTTITLNGQPLSAAPQAVEGTQWRVYHAQVPAGVNRLGASDPVGLYVYGYDCDVSYGYPGGMNLDIDAIVDF
ncbi:MAG: hypothetical protein EA398_17285 [Deltaproteobacteria bacterium]|nr:MAG: hypothetical protein EA398_17285 [Deltaproteobacteria bacterium]